MVAVTENVYEQTSVTYGPDDDAPHWRVSGYVSWRQADVKYYEALYELLDKQPV